MPEAVAALAGRFWADAAAAGVAPVFPRPIRAAAEAALPVAIVDLPDLTPASARRWLDRGGASVAATPADADFDGCPCRGLLHTSRGVGTLFVRANDPPEERRLTVAHEVAHYLLHCDAPRRQLLGAFGASAAAVLDGEAAASPAERGAAALAGLRLGPHVHLLAGADREEGEADELGLELLAPAAVLRPLVGENPAEVAARFGLPIHVMRARLRRLRPAEADPFVVHLAARLRGAAR